MRRTPPTTALPPPRPFPWAARRDAFAARLTREVAQVTLLSAACVGLATGDGLVAIPQALASVALLAVGSRAEVLRLNALGRLAAIGASLAYAVLPSSGDAASTLARFLCAITATTLLQPKSPREQGLLLATALLQMALAAVLTVHLLAFAAGLLFALLVHRALGSFHAVRAIRRVEAHGGVLVAQGDPQALGRRADRAGLATLALAVPLFLALPRADLPLFPMVRASRPGVTAIGEQVRPRAVGQRADGEEVVAKVSPETLAARDRDPYFRVAAYEVLEGAATWVKAPRPSGASSIDCIDGAADIPGALVGDEAARYEFVVEAEASADLPMPEGVSWVKFRDPVPQGIDVDRGGAVRPRARRSAPRWAYSATAPSSPPPRWEAKAAAGWHDRCLVLPERLATELREPVAERTRGAVTDREKVTALCDWIRSTCTYSLTDGAGGDDPVGEFLLRTRRGYCEHFAAALAACCRAAGVPSRVVGGYHASGWNRFSGFWPLRRRDAHAWVEAYLRDRGWTAFDATPAGAREEDPYGGLAGLFAGLRDALEFEWSRHVLGYDHETQARSWTAISDFLGDLRRLLSGPAATWALVPVLVAVTLRLARGRRSRSRVLRRSSAVRFYERALRRLARRGLHRAHGETAAAFASRVERRLSPGGALALEQLTRAFEGVRYGNGPHPAAGPAGEWIASLE